jgi:hypothetical protein
VSAPRRPAGKEIDGERIAAAIPQEPAMRMLITNACAIALTTVLSAAPQALAQCTTIDFDNLAVGTSVTTQYPGVTFSGRNPEGDVAAPPIIYNPSGSTTSEPQCLSAAGAVDFSHEFIRIDFARDQTEVTFTLGVRTGCTAADTIAVRYYDVVSGVYTFRGSFSPNVNGTLPNERVWVFVRVTRPSNMPFRRIEIEGDLAHGCGERYELIDDLSFDIDPTPPIADLTIPAVYACQCNTMPVTGFAYDPDGAIDDWRLERKAPDAANWTLIATSSTEIIGGQLAIWTTTAPTGWYVLRLTVTNECGLTAEDEHLIWLDKSFDNLALRSPTAGAVLGGNVCFDGTASDHCAGNFTIEKRPSGGVFAPVDSILPPWITNDPLGSWNTRVGTPDGNYEVRLSGTDDCGNTASSPIVSVVVDNTLPTAIITTPASCGTVAGVVDVRGVVNDAHLTGWSLSYTGGNIHGWLPVPGGSGAGNVNGHLANWDTSGLPPCCYTLRLVATDSAAVDCGGARNQVEYLVSVDVGGAACPADLNGDGVVDIGDLALFLGAFGTVCP